ncbi:unnamed protein product [Rotaria sp. Silwood1]|nr:unnamed protein product [Rotaria sp. Silwood1]
MAAGTVIKHLNVQQATDYIAEVTKNSTVFHMIRESFKLKYDEIKGITKDEMNEVIDGMADADLQRALKGVKLLGDDHSRFEPYAENLSIPIEDIEATLGKIILTIHLRQEYVSVARVEQDLLTHYGVQSFRELGVNQRDLKTLTNHIHRDKDVTFYMQVFEQIFNLCTLYDLAPLIAKFLKVNTYEDAHLGPLDEHPAIKRVFKYKPIKRHEPIPEITSGEIIHAFVEFQQNHQQRKFLYEDFIDELVQEYQFEKREQLGLFCRSFPYLSEVTRKLTQEWNRCDKRFVSDATRSIINEVEDKLREIKQEVSSELKLSSYTNKSPMSVFNHLISVVDKHLNIAQQKAIHDLLIKIQKDDLLRCLLNISIYLGSMEKPEKFIAEFQRLTQSQNENQNSTSLSQQSSNTKKSLDNNYHQRNSQYTSNIHNVKSEGNVSSTINETSFTNLSSSSYETRSPVPLQDICSDLFHILVRFDSVLTIRQLYDIQNHLCKKYSIKNFSEFYFNDNDDDDENNYLDLISFIHKHRDKIDPHGDLSIYEYISSTGDRQEIHTFVNQLTVIKNWREKQEQNEYSSDRKIIMSKDQSSAVERALQYKFAGLLGHNRVSQIIKKAKHQYTKKTRSIIHYEESLLDEVGLSRLGICPSSLLVDEKQLCEIILQCPIMYDLSTWLQWSNYFQFKYGTLKMFIARKEQELDRLLLLETSNHELLRLPIDSSFDLFEKELYSGNIRVSVGHLCALIICEYVKVNQLPMIIYRQVISTWLIRLRSSAGLNENSIEPMRYVLEFLTYLPILIGQSRIVQELLFEPIDEVFGNNEDNQVFNTRQRIWALANAKQKSKLEVWGHLLDIDEWKNENKWKGINETQEEPIIQSTYEHFRQSDRPNQRSEILLPINDQVSTSTVTFPSTPPISETRIPIVNDNNRDLAAFEHIKQIRERLGVDNNLDTAGKSIVNNLQGLIKRSLDKLSNDLYSEQGHFVLELIQNADDNQYSSDCLPTLRFVISSDRILVCNNEIGFQPDHIEAICNVGRSTKGKHKQGYAGHKGIGFKSVFMVSHRPEIHSGNYHFCFDTKNEKDKMSYINPIWLDDCEENLSLINEWKTCIRLPIKQDGRADSLKRKFDDIHARLLLFLNRLRQIEIIDQKRNNQTDIKIFTRIDHAQGQIIELQKKTTSEQIIKSFWLVVKKVVQLPINIKVMQFSDIKCDAESTTLAIAYPLDHIHEKSSYENLPCQPLFAYLPLRSYGFRFILQGDFEVPATRQEILRDNGWNEWLKKEMIQLLPLAYEYFKMLPDILQTCSIDVQNHIGSLNLIQTIKYFIKTIPTYNDIDPYFNSFIDKSIQGLMGSSQLPVIIDEINQTIQWISPTQCVFVRDSFIKEIFTPDLLFSHFKNYYLNEQFVHECDQSILIKLGCRKLDFSNILRLIRSLYTQNEQEHTTKTTNIEQIAQWFLCIDYSLQQERERPGFNIDDDNQREQTTIEQLKQMKIIPLKDQTQLVSIEQYQERAIFFPLDKSIPYAKHLKIVLEDLPTIDERLLDYIEKKYPRRLESIKRLLKDLGISESRNSRRIYSNHMIPIISDISQWSAKSDSVLIAYVIFIYKEIYAPKPDHFASEMEKLKNMLIIKIRQGKFIRINSNGPNIVHLTSSYGCKTSLDSLKLSTHQFTFISDDYFQQYHRELFYQDRERYHFINFLNELDIHDFFLVKRVKQGFINVEQLVGTQWSHAIGKLSLLIFEPFIIQDNRCDEFDALISSKDNASVEQYSQILLYLDNCFELVKHFFASSVIRSRDQHTGNSTPVLAVESSFCLLLRTHSWIPVIGGQFYKPIDVYYLPVNHPFRHYVPCLDQAKISLKNENFINLLGFKREILPITIFELFMKWSCNLDSDSLWNLINTNQDQSIPCTMSTTVHQSCRDTINNIRQVYMSFAADKETLTHFSRFRQWPLIFIPRTADIGEFLYANEVFWHDPESLLTVGNTFHYQSTQCIALQTYYGNVPVLHQLFVNVFKVKQQPTLEDYLPLLNNLVDKNIQYIWKCIRVITRLAFAQNKQEMVKDKCYDWAFIPCISYTHNLAKYTDQLYYPHDLAIADLFSDIIPIINISDDLKHSNEFKQQFCSLFNIEDLSDVIQVVIDVENEQSAKELLDFYSHSIDLIQHYLFTNQYISENRSNHLQSILSQMSFISVESIRLSYRHKENITRTSPLSSVLDSYIDESTRKFYILHKYEKSENRHIDTMVNYLIQDETNRLKLSKYIQNLFKIYQDNGLDGLNKQRENLPEQQLSKWIIPQIIKEEPIALTEDEDEVNSNESIIIPSEMLENLLNEPAWKLPNANPNVPRDPNQSKMLTCFPAKPGSGVVTETSNTNTQLTDASDNVNRTHQIPSQNISNSSESIASLTIDKTINANEHTNEKKNVEQVKSRENEQHVDITHQPESNESGESAKHQITPVTMGNFMSPARINFEQIRISTFTNVTLCSETLANPPTSTNVTSSNNENDIIIGRRGEEFVYKYLQWKYPGREIQWINKDGESGQPFDIRMILKGKQNQIDLIEVKTTRLSTQNTFPISIREIECLISNQNNYHIYRVYYSNDEISSTITIVSQIKYNLEQKQLSLSMTIPS